MIERLQRVRPWPTIAAAAVAALLPPALAAQTPPAAAGASAEQVRMRRDIAAFERALESAVNEGAQRLGQHVQTSATPQSVLLTGLNRARGFRLEGYGILFDVEFPSIRRTVAWTLRALGAPDPELLAAMKELRSNAEHLADPRTREELDRAIRTLEEQMTANQRRTTNVAAGAAAAEPPPLVDPRVVYAADLTGVLVNAVLAAGPSLGLAPAEWLAVAARESLDFRFMPEDASGSPTLMIRMKGSDLAALRDGTLTREEARDRVEVGRY